MRHSGWSPDHVLRLFKRGRARFSDDLVHERVICDGAVARLGEPLIHHPVLRLEDSAGKVVGSNFYWLSTKPETLDWAKTTWWMTPTASYADYTAISQLPKLRLRVSDRTERKGE